MVIAEVLEEGECIKTLFPDENPMGCSAGVGNILTIYK